LKDKLEHNPCDPRSAARHFVSAVQFLTIIPISRTGGFEARFAAPFFPMVGLLIGVVIATLDTGVAYVWPEPVAALIDVVALALITGALHLDGLADSADGLYGRRPPELALSIMKDSRVGAIGLVVVVCCLALKWAGIYGIAHHRLLWLLIVPAYARAAVLFGIRLLPYGRPGGGTGAPFFEHRLPIAGFWGLALLAVLSLAGGWGAVWINLGLAVLAGATLTFYRLKMGCITGDMLGALIEICETGLFLLLSAWDG
jgi:adenosylcobinamide-GDP ribazoletransferase